MAAALLKGDAAKRTAKLLRSIAKRIEREGLDMSTIQSEDGAAYVRRGKTARVRKFHRISIVLVLPL